MSEKALKRYLKRRDKKERGQLSGRKHLGLLEKKKDYKVRAKNYNKKRDLVRKLQTKAELRNVDEFHHGMEQTRVDSNGNIVSTQRVHRDFQNMRREKDVDSRFMDSKIVGLRKEIDRDRSSLAALSRFDKMPERTQGFFVDDEDAARSWTAVEHFNTVKELVGRTHNRLTKDQLEEDVILNKKSPGMLAKVESAQKQAYEQVRQKEKKLREMERHDKILKQQRNLMKGGRVIKRIKKDKFGDEIKSKTVFKWKTERKK